MYLEIDEGFDSHPKTVRLCRVLGDVNAGQYLIRIWAWACRSSPDGDLSGMESADIEAIARYAPGDGKLFAALTDRWSPKFGPWVDIPGDGAMRLHGWDERQGAAIKRMEKHAERMREYRACHVARTNGARSTTVQSSPDKTSQEEIPPTPQGGKKRKPRSEGSEAFEVFWRTYPQHRHVEKAEAIKQWPGDEHASAIIAALAWQTTSQDWTKDGGSFVPHPKRYLSKRRWLDERPRTNGGAQPELRWAAPAPAVR